MADFRKYTFKGFFEEFEFSDLTAAILSLYGFNLYSSDVILNVKELVGAGDNFYKWVLVIYFAIPIIVFFLVTVLINTNGNGYAQQLQRQLGREVPFLLKLQSAVTRLAARTNLFNWLRFRGFLLPYGWLTVHTGMLWLVALYSVFLGFFILAFISLFRQDVVFGLARHYKVAMYGVVVSGCFIFTGWLVYFTRVRQAKFRVRKSDDFRAQTTLALKHFMLLLLLCVGAFLAAIHLNYKKTLGAYKDWYELSGITPSRKALDKSGTSVIVARGDAFFARAPLAYSQKSVQDSMAHVVLHYMSFADSVKALASTLQRLDTLCHLAKTEEWKCRKLWVANQQAELQLVKESISRLRHPKDYKGLSGKLRIREKEIIARIDSNRQVFDTCCGYPKYCLEATNGTYNLIRHEKAEAQEDIDSLTAYYQRAIPRFIILDAPARDTTPYTKLYQLSGNERNYAFVLGFKRVLEINQVVSKVYFGLRLPGYLALLFLSGLCFCLIWLDAFLTRTVALEEQAQDDLELTATTYSEVGLSKYLLFAVLACAIPVFTSTFAFSLKEPFLGKDYAIGLETHSSLDGSSGTGGDSFGDDVTLTCPECKHEQIKAEDFDSIVKKHVDRAIEITKENIETSSGDVKTHVTDTEKQAIKRNEKWY